VIRDLAAWLTTTVGRLALDALGSARVRPPRLELVGDELEEALSVIRQALSNKIT
jgi:RNA polymerase sigma-70 factor (ECF subfamily)